MYKFINNAEDVKNFLEEVNYFHDGLVKELSCTGRGFVDENLLMYEDLNPSDCRLIIHQQSELSPCTEIIFENISKLIFDSSVVLEPEIVFNKTQIVFRFTSSRHSIIPLIAADRMKYRAWGKDKLGRRSMYTDPVPVGEVNEAKVLDGKWIECEKCGEVWEDIEDSSIYIQCAKCGKIYSRALEPEE